MKRLLLFLFPVLLVSCKKEEIDRTVPLGMLYKITLNDKATETFEYEGGLLKKETIFWQCDNPIEIVSYQYQSGRISSVQKVSFRDFKSSMLCSSNTENPLLIDYRIKYDDQGRVTAITLPSNGIDSYYVYDGSVQIIQVKKAGSDEIVGEYRRKFDDRGNLAEEGTVDTLVYGGTMRYEYDDKPNPFHQINSFSNLQITAFNGPNNPIKAFDAKGNQIWEKKYTYNENGYPLTRDEGYGYVYVYHYGQ